MKKDGIDREIEHICNCSCFHRITRSCCCNRQLQLELLQPHQQVAATGTAATASTGPAATASAANAPTGPTGARGGATGSAIDPGCTEEYPFKTNSIKGQENHVIG